jgi:outer membrane phospholipase A
MISRLIDVFFKIYALFGMEGQERRRHVFQTQISSQLWRCLFELREGEEWAYTRCSHVAGSQRRTSAYIFTSVEFETELIIT